MFSAVERVALIAEEEDVFLWDSRVGAGSFHDGEDGEDSEDCTGAGVLQLVGQFRLGVPWVSGGDHTPSP